MKKIIYALILSLSIAIAAPVALAEDIAPEVKAALLMEASTGTVLYEKNPDEHLPIASVTKIMTMLLIMEQVDSGKMTLDDTVTASENASSYGGSTMFLETGEQMSVNELLKGIAVASANDGCVAMAEHMAGSEAAFVEMMNKKALELGMENTHFVNTNGLDADDQYSSARDVAIMSRELIKHDKIYNYTKIWTDSMRGGKFELANTNKLIRYYNGATGLKTGSTSKAGCCLSATAERNGMSLIAVVLGAPDTKTRFSSASALLNSGFTGYSIDKKLEKGEIVGKINVRRGKSEQVDVAAKDGYSILVSKANPVETEKTIKMNDYVIAPVSEGDKVGEAVFMQNGKEVAVIDLVAKNDVCKKNFAQILAELLHGLVSF
ncbi:MAG: D-alanyl-D-alanine carboxypeptidase [Firmicutes bacterium]|nr:D-alanyl-D-alanine carboxypeptidase [Bacillota bacterium]